MHVIWDLTIDCMNRKYSSNFGVFLVSAFFSSRCHFVSHLTCEQCSRLHVEKCCSGATPSISACVSLNICHSKRLPNTAERNQWKKRYPISCKSISYRLGIISVCCSMSKRIEYSQNTTSTNVHNPSLANNEMKKKPVIFSFILCAVSLSICIKWK